MHLQSFIPLLLVSSASALPGGGQNIRREETPTPSPSTVPPPEEPPTTTTEEPEPTLPPDEKCKLPFNDGDAEVSKDTWEKSGAGTFLSDFLTENGVEAWVDKLFQATVGGGEQGGSTYDCTNFPAESGCTSPGHELCMNYDPPEMFFVHLSLSNLYGSFVKIHEDMQDDMITELASEIKKIVDIFGPPPPDDSTFAILIGAFVGAAALAGPAWWIAAPATAGVAGLNLAAGLASADPEDTPEDFEHDLEQSLGQFYSNFADILEDTVTGIFAGDFSGIENFDEDPVEFIINQFDEGKMLDHTLVNPDMDGWIDATIQLIRQGLVIQALKKEEYYIWQDYTTTDEEKCADSYGGSRTMIDDMCTALVKDKGAPMTGHHPTLMDDDMTDAFINDYGFDWEEALRNAIDCAADGGEAPDLTELPPFGEVPSLPPCFVNLEVKLQDFYGIPPDEDDY